MTIAMAAASLALNLCAVATYGIQIYLVSSDFNTEEYRYVTTELEQLKFVIKLNVNNHTFSCKCKYKYIGIFCSCCDCNVIKNFEGAFVNVIKLKSCTRSNSACQRISLESSCVYIVHLCH